MVQEIITYALILLAALYTIYSLIKSLTDKSKGGCSKSCSCGSKSDLKNALKRAKLNPKI